MPRQRLLQQPCADRPARDRNSPAAPAATGGTSRRSSGCRPSLAPADDSDSADSPPNCHRRSAGSRFVPLGNRTGSRIAINRLPVQIPLRNVNQRLLRCRRATWRTPEYPFPDSAHADKSPATQRRLGSVKSSVTRKSFSPARNVELGIVLELQQHGQLGRGMRSEVKSDARLDHLRLPRRLQDAC